MLWPRNGRVCLKRPPLQPPKKRFEVPVTSPCISICRMDPNTELCEGCLRTIDEIGDWGSMSNARRLQVLEAVERRRVQLFDGN
jgi:predicted Fe-S protein YdhL (DUF1289 family)